jgi:DNA-binding NarL/FixJ family response regulator
MDRARQALEAGADAMVMKCQQPRILWSTVESQGKGLAVSLRATSNQSTIAKKAGTRKAVTEPMQFFNALTDREREVIGLVEEGLSNREIANNLCISETTVRHQLTSIFDKLGVSNQQKLLLCAYQYELVEHGLGRHNHEMMY